MTTTSSTTAPTHGVIGATGKTGRRVVRRLTRPGIDVRPLSRVTGFEWTDPDTWSRAVGGLRGLYVAHHLDFVAPGVAESVTALAEVAAEAGVERMVLLAGRNEAEAEAAEAALRAVFPGLTAIRAAWFVQNLTEGEMADQVHRGVLALPVGNVPEPFVDADDIAEIAVDALIGEGHAGAAYEVTGPRALTFAELAEELAPGTTYHELTLDEARAAWTEAGLPDGAVWLLGQLFGTLFDGRNTSPADGVQRALGRAPRDVREVRARD